MLVMFPPWLSICPSPWIAVLAVFLMVVLGSLGSGFYFIFITSSLLILSTVFLTLSRPKAVLVEKPLKGSEKKHLPHRHEVLPELKQEADSGSSSQKRGAQEEEALVKQPQPESGSVSEKKFSQEEELQVKQQEPETKTLTQKNYAKDEEIMLTQQLYEIHSVTQKKCAQQRAEEGQTHGYFIRSSDLLSESESQNRSSTSEDSELSWPFPDNAGSPSSDGSISDEESLIEIAIPGGHYVVPQEFEEDFNKYHQQEQVRFSSREIFEKHGLMELQSEISEEENLIEIDISMGSIKCSRFGIKA